MYQCFYFNPKKKKNVGKKGGALLTWAVLNGLPSAPHHFSLSPLIFLWSVSHTNTHEQLLFISHSTVAAFFGGFVLFLSDGGVIQCPFFSTPLSSLFSSSSSVGCASDRFVLAVGSLQLLCLDFPAFFRPFFPQFFPSENGNTRYTPNSM